MERLGLSNRALAKLLADDPTNPRHLDQQRTNVKRWLDPERGITEASSARLARHFDRPPDFFVRKPHPRVRQADRLAQVSERVEKNSEAIDEMTETLTALEERLVAVERRQDVRPRAGGEV
jgi:hypothetical protein